MDVAVRPSRKRKADDTDLRKLAEQAEIVEAAEILVDMKGVVDADITVAVQESLIKPSGDVPMSGMGRKKHRGGVEIETAKALKELTVGVLTEAKDTAKSIDTGFASLIRRVPKLQTILSAYAGAKVIQNPEMFTNLVETVRTNWASMVPAGGASYSQILEEIGVSAEYIAKFVTVDQVAYVKESPLYATVGILVTSTLLVRYLANNATMTPMDYLEAKARYALSVLGMVYTGVKEIVTAPETDQQKKVRLVRQLREATQRVPTSKIKYEGVGPAAVPGLMTQKPSPAELTAEAAQRLADTVSKIVVVLPDNEAANILAAMNAPPPAAPAPQADAMQEGGKRRKYKTAKRAMKKKRVTRRRAMYGMPRFTY